MNSIVLITLFLSLVALSFVKGNAEDVEKICKKATDIGKAAKVLDCFKIDKNGEDMKNWKQCKAEANGGNENQPCPEFLLSLCKDKAIVKKFEECADKKFKKPTDEEYKAASKCIDAV